MGQNLVPLVNIKIAGKWMFIALKMVCIGIDPKPFLGITFQDPPAASEQHCSEMGVAMISDMRTMLHS